MAFAWEDLPIDQPTRFGAYELTQEAIISFASEWDPQPWHLDADMAADSIFGELVACAAHLFAIISKLMLDNPMPAQLLAGLGNRNLRLAAPGRVGDVLSMRLTYTGARPSRSRPGTGIVDMRVELVDADDRVVLRNEGSMLVAGRDIACEDEVVEPTLRTRAVPLVDLTTLADDDSDERVLALCARAAETGVAAVCIFPRFVATASEALAGTGVLVATVVNFPAGTDPAGVVIAETLQALADGADEIDLVVPYRAAIAGDLDAVESMVRTIDDICGEHHLKAILETGALGDPDLIAAVALRAIAGGADFLKTSTGKIDVGATPEAAAAILDAIGAADRVVGIKLSGGVRTAEQAAAYLAQIDEAMGPAWASPTTVRFGASGLLDDLLR